VTVFLFILLVLALVFFLVAAIAGYSSVGEGSPPGWHRMNFVALGLACWVATALIAAFPH